jgi:hypothetical protein
MANTKGEVAQRRDETIKRMLATPPLKHADEKHPRKKAAKRKTPKRKSQD